eukprot:508147_1
MSTSLLVILLFSTATAANHEQLISDDGAIFGQHFGRSIAISDDTMFIGAKGPNGTVYIFNKTNNIWQQKQQLTVVNEFAGISIDATNNYLIVGAWLTNNKEGSAYIFSNINGVYQETAKLVPFTNVVADCGVDVAIHDTVAVVGCFTLNNRTGAAVIYELINDTWNQTQIIYGNTANDLFGGMISIKQNVIAISPAFNKNETYVKIIQKNGTNWQVTQTINSHDSSDSWFAHA